MMTAAGAFGHRLSSMDRHMDAVRAKGGPAFILVAMAPATETVQ